MRALQSLLVLALVFLSGCTRSDDNKDSWKAPKLNEDSGKATEHIVGLWQAVKGFDVTPHMSFEFERAGTFKVMERTGPGLTKDNKKTEERTVTVAEGRYKVEGKQLTMTGKVDGDEVTSIRMIKTLTDRVLIVENDKGKTSEFEKRH